MDDPCCGSNPFQRRAAGNRAGFYDRELNEEEKFCTLLKPVFPDRKREGLKFTGESTGEFGFLHWYPSGGTVKIQHRCIFPNYCGDDQQRGNRSDGGLKFFLPCAGRGGLDFLKQKERIMDRHTELLIQQRDSITEEDIEELLDWDVEMRDDSQQFFGGNSKTWQTFRVELSVEQKVESVLKIL